MRLTALVLAALGLASAASAQTAAAAQAASAAQGGTMQITSKRVEPIMQTVRVSRASTQTPLVLEVVVRRYVAGNRMAASAGDSSSDKLESYVWVNPSLCGLSASDTPPATVPGVGWHFTGQVVSRSPGQMAVRVNWQRMWENGTRLSNGPRGTQDITLRNGERVELDRVLPVGASSCGAVEAKLEAAVVDTPAFRLGVMSGQFVGVGRGGRGGVASASGRASGQGVGGGVAGGTATGATRAGGRGGRGAGTGTGAGAGTGVQSGVAAGATRGTTTSVTAAGRGRGRGAGQGQQGQQAQATQGQRGQQAQATQGQRGQQGVATGATTTGGRGGRAATSGTGTTTVYGATGQVAGGRGGRGQASQQGQQLAADANRLRAAIVSAASYDAELWLVHRKPDGIETVQQQTVRFGGSSATFKFPPVQVNTSKGMITIDITGRLQSFVGTPPDPDQPVTSQYFTFRSNFATAAGVQGGQQEAQRLMVTISRRARATGQNFLDTTGGSSMAIDVPAPNDVLSFEFPALQKATEDLLKGHLFSLRVRVTGR
jgi:hypothetical protein